MLPAPDLGQVEGGGDDLGPDALTAAGPPVDGFVGSDGAVVVRVDLRIEGSGIPRR